MSLAAGKSVEFFTFLSESEENNAKWSIWRINRSNYFSVDGKPGKRYTGMREWEVNWWFSSNIASSVMHNSNFLVSRMTTLVRWRYSY